MTDRRDVAAGSSSSAGSPRCLEQQRKHEIFQLLLPSDRGRARKSKEAGGWETPFQSQQPTRPHTSRTSGAAAAAAAAGAPPRDVLVSPRAPVASSPRQHGASPASTPRCRSAGVASTSRRLPLQSVSEQPHAYALSFRRPLASPRTHCDTSRVASVSEPAVVASNGPTRQCSERDPRVEGPYAAVDAVLEVNARAREHVEVKACLLAYMHRIDVDELKQLKQQAQQEIERVKLQRFVTQSGIAGDGSEFDVMRRKTSFLLRHFFSLDEGSSQKQERLLYDIVDEWLCRDDASSGEVGALWTSITRHIEQSYILRRKLVAASDPDRLSVGIALDCLKKLAVRLPEYQRVLDVATHIIESGLYVHSAPEQSSGQHQQQQQQLRFYFDECERLESALNDARALAHRTTELHSEAAGRSVREQICRLLPQLREDEPLEKEALFLALLRANMELLACLACGEVLRHFFQHPQADKKRFFYDMFMKQLDAAETKRLLQELATSRLSDFRSFVQENLEAMDAILMSASADNVTEAAAATRPLVQAGAAPRSTVSPPLFHRLLERHPSEFAAILWHSPFLTAQIFQESPPLVARILEQNVLLVSQVLLQRSDVLLSLLHHTLKDSTAVLEEFLTSHPRGFTETLANRPAALADAVRANASILSELLLSCRPTFAKVLLSTPETVSHILKTTPELLALVLRAEPSLLALAFAAVPHLLSETLEQHPEFFLDVAHRRPALVTRLFAKHPDLLMEPLEANPTLFSNFLVFHRDVLPDLAAPDFNPLLFQIESKKFAEAATQTSKSLSKSIGTLRVRERLELQEAEIVALTRLPQASAEPPAASPSRKRSEVTPEHLRRRSGAMPEAHEAAAASESDVFVDSVALLPPSAVVQEIARLYVKKIRADEQDDAERRPRQELVAFAKDAYLVELGFAAAAHHKLAQVLRSASSAGHTQEKVRIKWLLRFMHATPKLRLHPVALDFYLLVLQRLIPAEHLAFRLEDEPYHACLVAATAFRELVDETLVSRLLASKEQRHQLLLLQVSERDVLSDEAAAAPAAAGPNTPHARRRDSALSVQLQHSPAAAMLHVDDVLDSTMNVWLQFQARVREEWSVLLQRANPDGSGVVHFGVFAALVRSKLGFVVDDRPLLDVFHTCGEENELGEFALLPEDFTLAMFALQEQHALRHFARPSS